MNRQFRSDNPRRLQLLRDQSPVGKNGIDFVEITSVDQQRVPDSYRHCHLQQYGPDSEPNVELHQPQH